MSRPTAVVLNAIALGAMATLAAWRFIQAGAWNGLDMIDVLLALVFGLVVPGALIIEWWSARADGDASMMRAIEHVTPIVSLTLLGIAMVGR